MKTQLMRASLWMLGAFFGLAIYAVGSVALAGCNTSSLSDIYDIEDGNPTAEETGRFVKAMEEYPDCADHVDSDGKTYLARVISGGTKFQPERHGIKAAIRYLVALGADAEHQSVTDAMNAVKKADKDRKRSADMKLHPMFDAIINQKPPAGATPFVVAAETTAASVIQTGTLWGDNYRSLPSARVLRSSGWTYRIEFTCLAPAGEECASPEDGDIRLPDGMPSWYLEIPEVQASIAADRKANALGVRCPSVNLFEHIASVPSGETEIVTGGAGWNDSKVASIDCEARSSHPFHLRIVSLKPKT